jgi:hypothetical protein
MWGMARLSGIPYLHGRLSVTGIAVVFESIAFRSFPARNLAHHGLPVITPTDLDRPPKGLFAHDLSLV